MDEEEDKRIIQPGQRAQPKPAENQAPKAPALPPLPKPTARGGMGRARPVQPVRAPTSQERANLLVQDVRQMALQAEEQMAFFNKSRTRAILDEVEARVSDPTQKDGATYTEDIFLPRKLTALKEMAGSGASPDDLMAWAKKELPAPYRPTDWEHKRRVWEYATVEGNAARLQNKAVDYLKRLYGMSSKDAWEKTKTAEDAAQVISDTENALERYAADNSFELGAESAIRGFMGPAIVKAWESLGDLTTPQAQMKAREVQRAFMQEAMMYRQKRLSDAGWTGTIEEIFADVLPALPRQLGAQITGALVGGTLGGGAAMGLVSAADAKVLGAPQHQIRREAMKGTVLGVFGSLGERGVIAASMKLKGNMPSLMARFLGTGAVSVASEYGVAKATGEEYTLKDAVSSFLLEGAFAAAETSPQAQRHSAWKAYTSGDRDKILSNGISSAAKLIEEAAGRPLTEEEFFGFYDAQSKVGSSRFRAEIMGELATKIANERVAQQEAAQRLIDARAKFMAEREQRRQAERRGFGSLDEEAVANIGMQEGVPLETGGAAPPMSEEELSQRMAAGAEQFETEAAPAREAARQERARQLRAERGTEGPEYRAAEYRKALQEQFRAEREEERRMLDEAKKARVSAKAQQTLERMVDRAARLREQMLEAAGFEGEALPPPTTPPAPTVTREAPQGGVPPSGVTEADIEARVAGEGEPSGWVPPQGAGDMGETTTPTAPGEATAAPAAEGAEAAPLPPGKARLSMQETDVVGDVEDVGGKPSVRIAPYQLTAIRQTPEGVMFGEMYRGTAGDERASGTWWADSREAAREYAESSGGKVYKAEVVLKRPFFAIDDAGRAELERLTGISEQDGLMETKEQWMSALEQAGYDGLVIDDTSETVDTHLTVVPFRDEGVRYTQKKRGLGGKKKAAAPAVAPTPPPAAPTEPVGLGRADVAQSLDSPLPASPGKNKEKFQKSRADQAVRLIKSLIGPMDRIDKMAVENMPGSIWIFSKGTEGEGIATWREFFENVRSRMRADHGDVDKKYPASKGKRENLAVYRAYDILDRVLGAPSTKAPSAPTPPSAPPTATTPPTAAAAGLGRGEGAAPPGVPGPGQRLLDGINEALARGETVYVRTATRATVISPETAAKWRDRGIPLFKLTAQGDLLMARGKKYDQIRSRAGWGSAVSTQTLDDVTKPESAYATPATQAAPPAAPPPPVPPAPARGMGGARRGKKAAPPAAPAAEVTTAQGQGKYSLMKDGIEGEAIDYRRVQNGNEYFEYAIGRVEEGAPLEVFRRSISNRGSYGGWRWETDVSKLKPAAPAATAPEAQAAPAGRAMSQTQLLELQARREQLLARKAKMDAIRAQVDAMPVPKDAKVPEAEWRREEVRKLAFRQGVMAFNRIDADLADIEARLRGERPATPEGGERMSVGRAGGGKKMASYFSGARTLEAGLGDVAQPVMAVEFDPEINAWANAVAGTSYPTRSVLDMDPAEIKALGLEHFHASPVCKNVSLAKIAGKVDELDVKSAEAVARVVREADVPVVTIENVPGYIGSIPHKIITDALTEAGYKHETVVVDAADYGGASMRARMITRAVKYGDLPALPPKTGPADWYEAVKDLIPSAPSDSPRGKGGGEFWEYSRLAKQSLLPKDRESYIDLDRPIYMAGGSTGKTVAYARNAGGPAPTVTSTEAAIPRILIPDANGPEVIRVPDGKGGFTEKRFVVKRVTGRMMARLMGLPDSFRIPDDPGLAKKVIGNGMHTATTQAIIKPLLERPMDGERMSVGRAGEGMEGAMPPSDPGLQSARAWAEQNLVPHLRAKPKSLRERFGPNPTAEQRAQHRREMVAWKRGAADLRDQLVDKIIKDQAEAETVDTVRTGTKVDRLVQDLKSGKITQEEFDRRVSEQMDAEMARREVDRARKATGTRIRGRERVMEVLYAASRKGEISPEMVDIADWLLSQNPELADTLALRVIERRGKYEKNGVEGVYNTGERLVTLFKGIGESLTVAHEILHHLERFMPAPMRAAIRAEYLAQLDKAIKAANADLVKASKANDEEAITKASNLILFLNNISEYHRGGKASLLEDAVGMITDGSVEQAMYRLTQPSEFWAENGSRILKSRFEAKDRGIWARIRQWMTEFAQKVKSVFGARSDAPVIKAMDYILKQSGAVETTSYGLGGRARTGDIYASGARAERQGRGTERFSVAAGGVPPEAGGGDRPVEGGEAPEGPGPGKGLGRRPEGWRRSEIRDFLGESGGSLRGKAQGMGDMLYEKIKMAVARGREIRGTFSGTASKVISNVMGTRAERAGEQAVERDGFFYYRWNALIKGWEEPKNKGEELMRDTAHQTLAQTWNEGSKRLGVRMGREGPELMSQIGRGRTPPHDFSDYILDVFSDPDHPDRQVVAQYMADATNAAIRRGEIPAPKAKVVDGKVDDGMRIVEQAEAYMAKVANSLSPLKPTTGAEGHLASEVTRDWIIPDMIPANMVSNAARRRYGSKGFVPLQKPLLGLRLMSVIDNTSRIIGAQIEFGRGKTDWMDFLTAEQKTALMLGEKAEGELNKVALSWISQNMGELIGKNVLPALRDEYVKKSGGLIEAGVEFDQAMRTAFGRPFFGGSGRYPMTTTRGKMGAAYDLAATVVRGLDLTASSVLNTVELFLGSPTFDSVQGAPPGLNIPLGFLTAMKALPGSVVDAFGDILGGQPFTGTGRQLLEQGRLAPYIITRGSSRFDSTWVKGIQRLHKALAFPNTLVNRIQSYQAARTLPFEGKMADFIAKWSGKNGYNQEVMAHTVAQRAGVTMEEARMWLEGDPNISPDRAEQIWKMAQTRAVSILSGEGIAPSESSAFIQQGAVQRLFTFWRWHDSYVRRNFGQLKSGLTGMATTNPLRGAAGAARFGSTLAGILANAVAAKLAYMFVFMSEEDREKEMEAYRENPAQYIADLGLTQLLAGPLGTIIRMAGESVVSTGAFLPGRIIKKGDALLDMIMGVVKQVAGDPDGQAQLMKGLENFWPAAKTVSKGEGAKEYAEIQRRESRPPAGLGRGMPPMPGFGPR